MSDRNQVHNLVQGQYEKYPYPAGDDDLYTFIKNKSFQGGCPSRFFHKYWPYKEQSLKLEILVAGCGTMQAAKLAVNLPEANITAIDLSQRSIDHTNMLLQKHDLHNVKTIKLPIEEIPNLGAEFDLIFSTGVLHHLPNPIEGLKALHKVLRDDGSMYLMLYSKYGRDGVYYMQDLLRRCQLSASSVDDNDLDNVRELIEQLPGYHPLAAKSEFFGNLHINEEIVDLLLHPQDRAYSLPEIHEYLDSCDMKMQELLFRGHYSPECSAIKHTRLYDTIKTLPDEEQLAIGELFRPSIKMHFFITCKNNRPEASYHTDLDADNWKTLVPIRGPGLQQDMIDLKPEYAANLSCQLHQFSDIKYPIHKDDAPYLSLTDGKNSIDDMFKMARASNIEPDEERIRSLFKTLVNYDIVYFRGHSDRRST